MIMCEYYIHVKTKDERIPKDKFISSWVINKEILKDDVFLGVLEKALEKVKIKSGAFSFESFFNLYFVQQLQCNGGKTDIFRNIVTT